MLKPAMIASVAAFLALVSAFLALQGPRKSQSLTYFQALGQESTNENTMIGTSLWRETIKVHWRACPWWKYEAHQLPESTGYIKVECTGGLNQMRRDFCDGVGIARLLNATLLIPHFDAALYWNDTSGFADIFDVDFFINQTRGYIHVVKELPEHLRNVQAVFLNCLKRKAPFDYIQEVLPVLQKNKVVVIRPAASQRSDRYPVYAKVARCQACYHAIRLHEHLEKLAKQMTSKIPRPFMSLHLRFEPDMIAYSQCSYPTLSEESAKAVEAARDERTAFTGEVELSWRRRGKCLLTPNDVAFILESLNMPRNMPIYLATGDGLLEAEGLTKVFTNVFNKSMLLGKHVLKKLGSNTKAALDYHISIHSDYYVATYFGNMEKMVMPMRVLNQKWNTLVLNKKEYATSLFRGLNVSTFRRTLWKSHRDAFVMGHGLALPDCFCDHLAYS